MPVIDHTTHPDTQKTGVEPYGCCNRTMKPDYYVKTRRYYYSMVEMRGDKYQLEDERVPHRLSTECRHDNSLNDPGCATCQHKGSGEKYSAMVKGQAR